jgi:hypothetical protein
MSPCTTRRAFLRSAGSTVLAATSLPLLIAACDADGSESSEATDPSDGATGAADEAAVSRALRDASRLAAAYAATLARHPDLRRRLAGLRADIDEHVDVLTDAAGDATGRSPSTPKVPRSARAARRQLATLEERAAERRRRDAGRVESGELGRLLAAMAACHAQHLRLLTPGDERSWASPAPDPAAAAADIAAAVDAMNAALAGEHAAIYAYGVIGGRLDYGSAPVREATAAWEAHRVRRAELIALVEAGDADPVVAEPGYRLPTPVDDVADARAVAQLVEDRCSVLYATLAATATGEIRAYAVDALIDAATRGLDWGAQASPLPGVATSTSGG